MLTGLINSAESGYDYPEISTENYLIDRFA